MNTSTPLKAVKSATWSLVGFAVNPASPVNVAVTALIGIIFGAAVWRLMEEADKEK